MNCFCIHLLQHYDFGSCFICVSILIQGAQILVFPEDGLQGFNYSRSSISGYLETVPDPQQESWNPCTEPGRHNNTEVNSRSAECRGVWGLCSRLDAFHRFSSS